MIQRTGASSTLRSTGSSSSISVDLENRLRTSLSRADLRVTEPKLTALPDQERLYRGKYHMGFGKVRVLRHICDSAPIY